MRIEGWDAVLVEYLRAAEQLSFEWGQNDCALWASGYVDRVTGSNHADAWRGLYHTEEGALALMAERGFADPCAIADSILKRRPLRLAKRGDLVLHPTGALGICDGRRSYFLMPERGISPFPTLQCVKAWEV